MPHKIKKRKHLEQWTPFKNTQLRVISAIDNNTRLSFKGRQYHVSGYNYRTKDVTMDARNGTITVPLDDIN